VTVSDIRSIVIDGRAVELFPVRITEALNNHVAPLDCGHKHVTGDTVWTDGGTLIWCTRCMEAAE
jgi:hypothetical protein